MPNIGAVLREEIARLSRKENRGEIDKTRKATAQQRRDIAQLKRQVVALERQLKLLVRKSAGAAPAVALASGANTKARFVAKGLRSQRARLGLSAADFGRLVGVTAQSIYNWESGKARPRGEPLARLAGLRGVGKREVAARLGAGAGAETAAKGARRAKSAKSPRAGRKGSSAKRGAGAGKRKARSSRRKASKASKASRSS